MYDFSIVVNRRDSACIKWDVTAPFDTDQPLTPFWIADMDFPTLPQVTEALIHRCEHPIFGYSIPPEGTLEAFCGWYHRRHRYSISPDEVICGIGVVTMLRYILDAVTAPGDSVVVMSPVYDAFYKMLTGANRKITDVPLLEHDGYYTMNLAGVEAALQAGARAILFCNPHNPVGRIWTRDELTQLAAICRRYDAWILSDEVHGDIELNGYQYVPMGAIEDARMNCSVCTAISKSFNLAGLHQSCTVIHNTDVRQKVDQLLRAAWLMGPNVMAYHAMKAAYTYGDTWLDELNAYLTANARYVVDTLAQCAPEIRLREPEGGYLMWLDLRNLGLSSAQINRVLTDEYRVALGNGSNYGPQSDGYMRLNIGCPRSTLEIAVNALIGLARDHKRGERI